jgi:hypothetical protein
MLPTLIEAIDVEMIRDGGSYAATFRDKDGGRYILFTRIKNIDRDETTRERTGYEPPRLIDCDATKRPPNTDKVVYSELGGPAIAITWAEARTIMLLARGLAKGLDEWRRKWLDQMNQVVTSDGGLPPDVDVIVEVKRHSSSAHES